MNLPDVNSFPPLSSTLVTYLNIDDVETISTAHGAGIKKVFSKGHVDLTRLTQVAWGSLPAGETIQSHNHPDMEECFFFLKGSGVMVINKQEYQLHPGVFLIVPATAEHMMVCEPDTLEFFYFGLQVYQ